MNISRCVKPSFSVIGKEGSTNDGSGFISKLWDDANSHFGEVASLAKKDDAGNLVGVWGAMTNFSRSFKPWEDNFSKGLYLAGVEAADDAQPPTGWTKWVIPSYEYIVVPNEGSGTFADTLEYMVKNSLSLAGAVQEYTSPADGKGYLYFPVKTI